MLLTSTSGWIAANVTGTAGEVSVRGALSSPCPKASLIVNVRAHIEPVALQDIVLASLRAAAGDGVREQIREIKSLSPGRPTPTHRFFQVA